MDNLSDSSANEDEHDIIALHEREESENDRNSLGREEDAGSENDRDSLGREEDAGSENDGNEDEKTTKRRIDPTATKHIVRNPVPKLNTERLKGPKGIHTIEKYFEGFKFHGKGKEKEDLDRIMKRMEHWAHRLFPKLDFDDFLDKTEKLGAKKDLQVFIKKYRQDMITTDDDLIVPDTIDNEEDKQESEPVDEFDLLIAEQIEKQKQATIQQESSVLGSSADNTSYTSSQKDTGHHALSDSIDKSAQPRKENVASQLSDEVKERIERNRQQAIQRRLARLKALQEETKRKQQDNENTLLSQDSISLAASEDVSTKRENLNALCDSNIVEKTD